MATEPDRAALRRRWCYHWVILGAGVVIVAIALTQLSTEVWSHPRVVITALVGVPLIAVVSRFPMVLDRGSGAIEVGFDSSILMYLLCTLDTADALVVWSAGVLLTQGLASKTSLAKVFNIGVGIVSSGLAAGAYALLGKEAPGTLKELIAVGLAAAVYFLVDFVLSALSVAIGSRTPLHLQLVQRGTLLAIACFVPLDSLGYLGAVVARSTPWWTLTLLVVPLATLLIATRAITRSRENARRLTTLFDAAVRAQTLVDRDAVIDALLSDASRLLMLKEVTLRDTPPGDSEIGIQVQLGDETHWIAAQALNRASSTVAADEQALRALAAVASDAMGRLALTDEMVHVARHDPLTDLPNRGILLDRVTQALGRARRQHAQVALFFIDLDGFKPVNDQFGHATGDAVLVQLARRLRECVREGDTVARLGGDEFAILLEDLRDGEVGMLCDRTLAAIEEPVDVGAQRLSLSASIGVAYGDGAETAAALLRNADLAMYEAKARGKGRCVEYEPTIGEARLERLVLVDDLRRAIDAGEIEVVYQPVVSVATGRISGAEALARWKRDGVPVPPDVFISVAEETGLIVALGESILDLVAADSPAVRAAAGAELSINVNISAGQLRDPGFIDTVARAASAMEGTSLVLEITERQGVDLDEDVLAVMRAITDMGVVFAIDDFGVGFSSISYLHDLPAKIIKADAALSAGIDSDERARALLRSVVLMGSTLGFDVVIEGIERDTQLAVVSEDAPTSHAQGYLLHRPMPLAQLLEVMEGERESAGRR